LDYDLSGALASFAKLPSRRRLPLPNGIADLIKLSDSYRYVWTGWLPAADRKTADMLAILTRRGDLRRKRRDLGEGMFLVSALS